jgi:hypothetical protein
MFLLLSPNVRVFPATGAVGQPPSHGAAAAVCVPRSSLYLRQPGLDLVDERRSGGRLVCIPSPHLLCVVARSPCAFLLLSLRVLLAPAERSGRLSSAPPPLVHADWRHRRCQPALLYTVQQRESSPCAFLRSCFLFEWPELRFRC